MSLCTRGPTAYPCLGFIPLKQTCCSFPFVLRYNCLISSYWRKQCFTCTCLANAPVITFAFFQVTMMSIFSRIIDLLVTHATFIFPLSWCPAEGVVLLYIPSVLVPNGRRGPCLYSLRLGAQRKAWSLFIFPPSWWPTEGAILVYIPSVLVPNGRRGPCLYSLRLGAQRKARSLFIFPPSWWYGRRGPCLYSLRLGAKRKARSLFIFPPSWCPTEGAVLVYIPSVLVPNGRRGPCLYSLRLGAQRKRGPCLYSLRLGAQRKARSLLTPFRFGVCHHLGWLGEAWTLRRY